MKKIRKVTVHGGHNPSGKIASGAVGILDESKEDRIIAKKVAKKLRLHGVKVKNCTVDNGTGQTDVLKKICAKCNAYGADLDISIHFNSGASDRKGNGRTTGTEVLLTANAGDKGDIAKRICRQMAKRGFTNRGVKVTKNLYFLNHTKAPAILVEVCFVDDRDDAVLYRSDKDAVADAIVNAVLNHNKAC